jgi:hypothetical protein
MDDIDSRLRWVEQEMASLRGVKDDVKALQVVINGDPAHPHGEPGLVRQVDSLEGSRWYARWGLRMLWSVLLIILGIYIKQWLGL